VRAILTFHLQGIISISGASNRYIEMLRKLHDGTQGEQNLARDFAGGFRRVDRRYRRSRILRPVLFLFLPAHYIWNPLVYQKALEKEGKEAVERRGPAVRCGPSRKGIDIYTGP
jgi:hypothetical protein